MVSPTYLTHREAIRDEGVEVCLLCVVSPPGRLYLVIEAQLSRCSKWPKARVNGTLSDFCSRRCSEDTLNSGTSCSSVLALNGSEKWLCSTPYSRSGRLYSIIQGRYYFSYCRKLDSTNRSSSISSVNLIRYSVRARYVPAHNHQGQTGARFFGKDAHVD